MSISCYNIYLSYMLYLSIDIGSFLLLLTETLMIQLRPQIVIGEAGIATCIVVPFVDYVLTLFCIDIGQHAGTRASGS